MTLAGLLDLIPPNIRDQVEILRVKPHNQMNRKDQFVYIKKRYVAFLPDGSHLCSCLQGRHLGLPCRHFFAAILIYRQHGFHINLVHKNWVVPSRRMHMATRYWIYLPQLKYSSGQSITTTPHSSRPPVFTASPEIQKALPPRTPKRKRFDPFQATKPLQTILETPIPSYKTATVNRQLKASATQRLDAVWRLVQDNPLQVQQPLDALDDMGSEVKQLNEDTHGSHPLNVFRSQDPNSAGNLLPQDPLTIPTPGRKSKARIQSSLEISQARKKRMKNGD